MKVRTIIKRTVAIILCLIMTFDGQMVSVWAEEENNPIDNEEVLDEIWEKEVEEEFVEEYKSEEDISDKGLERLWEIDDSSEEIEQEELLGHGTAGIQNNGKGGIYINIYEQPFTTLADLGYDAYGPNGCGWFASARAKQITGNSNITTWNHYGWYRDGGAERCGFSKGSQINAPALVCWSGHIAVLEKIDGGTYYFSEGGTAYAPDNDYTRLFKKDDWEIENYLRNNPDGNGSFLGFVYLSGEGLSGEHEINIQGNRLKYEINHGEAIITGYSGEAKGNLVIPSEISGSPVTEIGQWSFARNRDFTGSLTIPDSVKRVDDFAFYDTGFDGDLFIGNSVVSIGDAAFSSAGFKGNLRLGENVEAIGSCAFMGCKFTGNLILPPTLVSVGDNAFWWSNFSGDIVIPNSLTMIGEGCFGEIIDGDYIYYEYSDHKSGTLTLPNGLTRIENNCFAGNYFKGELSLPRNLTYIGDGALCNNNFEGSLYIPRGVTYIGKNTFLGCDKIDDIYIPAAVQEIGENAFYSYDEISDAVFHCVPGTYAYKEIVKRGGTVIDWEPIDNSSTIKKNSLEFMINNDGKTCTLLGPGNGFDFSGTLSIPESIEVGEVIFPVSDIDDGAFSLCTGIKGDLKIPSNIKTIGVEAFFGCENLESISFTSGLLSIGQDAFYACTGIKGTVEIRNTVNHIGNGAFNHCSSIDRFINHSQVALTLPVNNGYIWVNDSTNQIVKSISKGSATKYVGRENKEGTAISFYDGSSKYDIPLEWGSFFRDATYPDNYKLATIALTLSNNAEEGKIDSTLQDMGFNRDRIRSLNYQYTNYMTPAVTFGYQKVYGFGSAPKNLYIIVVRGTKMGTGDMTTDLSATVGGISIAADNVFSLFVQFAEAATGKPWENIIEDAKNNIVLVTGHSLGGGVANRIAYKGEFARFAPISQRHVYTFAAIRPIKSLIEREDNTYQNVHNIINIDDNVPNFPWGYYRVGRNYRFTMTDQLIKSKYKSLTGKAMPNPPPFLCTPIQDEFWRAHSTTIYLAFLLTNTKCDITNCKKRKITYVSWKCPVDVEIIDSCSNCVGRIVDNTVIDEGLNNVFMYTVGDEKYAIIYGDDNYDFKMTGNDNGTMEYIVSVYDNKTDSIVEEKKYSNVLLDNGRELESEIRAQNDTSDVLLFEVDEAGQLQKIINTDGTEENLTDGLNVLLDSYRYVYNGTDIKPTIRVYDGRKLLKEGKDYTVTYRDIRDASETNSNKKPTITIKGKGNYNQSVTKTFEIERCFLGDGYDFADDFTVTIADKQYNGRTQISKPTIKFGKLTLKENKDYTLSFDGDQVNPGEVTVIVNAKDGGNYTGSARVSYTIYEKGKGLSTAYVPAIVNQTYTGDVINLDDVPVVVKESRNSKTELVRGEDYDIVYANGAEKVNVGTANVLIRGKGDYTGTKAVTFKIVPKKLTEDMITVSDAIYTGTQVKPSVSITNGDVTVDSTQYTVSYSNNTKAASAAAGKSAPKVTVKGKGNFTGTATANFTIEPMKLSAAELDITIPNIRDNGKEIKNSAVKPTVKYVNSTTGKTVTLKNGTDYDVTFNRTNTCMQTADINLKGNYQNNGDIKAEFMIFDKVSGLNLNDFNVTAEDDNLIYSGAKITPKITVRTTVDDRDYILVQGKDYTVSYSNNINAADDALASRKPTWKVTGKGAYNGSVSGTFTILKRPFTSEDYTVTVADVKYNKKDQKPKVAVIDNNTGKALKSTDYTLRYDSTKEGVTENATVTVTGKGNYEGTLTGSFRVYETAISSAVFESLAKESYTGKPINPNGDKVRIFADKKKTIPLTENEDYVLSYGANTKAGKGTVTVTGIGKYGGSKTLTFTILPKWLQWLL